MQMRRTILDDAAIETFFERGFVVVREVFDSDEVAELRQSYEQLAAMARETSGETMHRGSQFVVEPDPSAPDDTRIHRIVWCGGAAPRLSEYGRDPRLVGLACELLDSAAVEQLINQAHFKFPGDDVAFEWHQDSKHRRYGTDLWEDPTGWGSFVETATAVDPMTPENGPLQFIPGSHELGHIEPDPETGGLPDDAFDPEQAVTPTLAPGDVVAFGPFVIHGSEPNRSSRPRRLFLNGYAHPEANERDYPGVDANRILDCPKRGDSTPD